MDNVHATLIKQLNSNNFSITKTRLAVFDALINKEPLAMKDLVLNLAKITDRASVYRTVDLYEKLGIVQRLNIGWKYKIELSDKYQEHHHHISCSICGLLISTDGDSHIEQDINELAKKHGFKILSHQLEIQGVCSNCTK